MSTRELDPDVCGNCNRSFNARRGKAATKRFIYKGTRRGVRIESSVAMWKALIEIFDLKSLGIWSKGGCKLELDTDLAFCQVCGLALAKLYGAMKAYLDLQDEDSYVKEVISNFSDDFAKLVNETEEFGADPMEIVEVKPDCSAILLNSEQKAGLTRKSARPVVVPKKFLYEGSSTGEKGIFAETSDNDQQDGDYFPPGAHDTEPTDRELDYYAAGKRPAIQSDFQDPNSQISQELFSIEFDPEAPSSPKEYALKEHLCQICATGFDKASNLKRHLLLTHEIGERTKDFVCTICGKAFYFNYLLKNHQVSHSVDRPAECNICKSTFKSKDSLLHHTRDVHRDHEDPKLQCKHCKRRFRQIRCLNEHILMIHKVGKGKKLISCSKGCGATFKRKKSMMGHVRQNQCREVIAKSTSKKKPESENEEDDGMSVKFYCPYKCNAVFKTRFTLSSHVRWRCPKNPACTQRLKQTRMKARAKVASTKTNENEEHSALAPETEPMEHEHDEDETFSVALEEECSTEVPTEVQRPDVNIKNEAEEMIVAEEHEIIAENIAEDQVQMRYEVVGVENQQQCFEVFEVQELPEGVHVQEIHRNELIQTIHYEEYPLSEEVE